MSWVMILMMMMMKRDTASADIISVSKTSGENFKLQSDFQNESMGTSIDFRWTHPHLLLNNRTTRCHHGRCELQDDGSLSFSRVQLEDSGVYTLEVYDQHGILKKKKVFRLEVEDISLPGRTTFIISSVILLFLLLLLITVFILRKRRFQRFKTADPKETQVYMVMHGNHGNKDKQEEEKKEEESLYVPCHPGVPAELAENVYV